MKIKTSVFLKLSSNYTSFFIYLGIITPFWAMWLSSRGLSPSEIGIIIAVPYIIKIIVAPLISQAADKRAEYWRPLLISVVFSVIVSGFYIFAAGFWSLLLITLVVNITMPAVLPLMETITVGQSVKHDLNYGHIRSFGSAAFIVATVLMGMFLKNNSIDYVLWAFYGSMILLLITVILLPRGNKKAHISSETKSSSPIKHLLSDGDFVWFLCVVGLLQMSHGVYYSMGSIYWKENGLGEDVIGFLWAVGVIAEIIFFLYFQKIINKYPLSMIFAIIGLLGALRWATMAMSMSLPVLFVVQLIHGLTFGASHLAAIHYLAKRVKRDYAASSQSLYSALPLGLGMGLATYVGGVIYEYVSSGAYFLMAFLCALAFLLSIIRFIRKK
ncbi:MAG: 3-phenylpropionate MFS transporter [Kordiimonadaceae bacterium]|mgnify:FL=1|jgi:MFS transporter, PPP family, 3-phenylpropionic acid transporter|nr:3-phenylpropionate MFS transporter [Kordiimonadaceae bacterium]MBT6035826.1 3-phenylpropionate MFS transporter [Kordiimonadaceae bacterium]MBT6330400.1 3-phenylpropionate MFS transporter [Kordiimonadaceae bacterium]MBT7583837.1 3-phenylpropionate MFS transporter [Kordiimonadaceae bacterium]